MMQLPVELSMEQERKMHYILDEGISGLQRSKYYSYFLIISAIVVRLIKAMKVTRVTKVLH